MDSGHRECCLAGAADDQWNIYHATRSGCTSQGGHAPSRAVRPEVCVPRCSLYPPRCNGGVASGMHEGRRICAARQCRNHNAHQGAHNGHRALVWGKCATIHDESASAERTYSVIQTSARDPEERAFSCQAYTSLMKGTASLVCPDLGEVAVYALLFDLALVCHFAIMCLWL